MDIYSIYKITNRVNDKVYIGFTSKRNVNRRWTEHKSISRNPQDPNHYYIHRAMNKYGVDNFVFEVIYQSKDRDYTLKKMEPLFIDLYQAEYNLAEGGDAPFLGRKHSAETIEQFKTRRHTEDTKARMSKTRKGMIRTEEHCENMSKANGLTWNVVHPDGTTEVIYSLQKFCREHGLGASHMSKVARGLQDNHKGYRCTKA